MTLSLLDTFALLTSMTVLAAVPSVSSLVVASRAASSGFASGATVAAGVVMGDVVLILAAMLGLVAMAQALGPWFVLMRGVAGLYLIWLGLSVWRSAGEHSLTSRQRDLARHVPSFEENVSHGTVQTRNEPGQPLFVATSARSSFLTGFFVTLGDQKALLFYFGFLPAFFKLDAVTRGDTLMVVFIAMLSVGAMKLAYAWLGARALQFSSARYLTLVSRVAAGMLLGAGFLAAGSAISV